MAEPDYLRAVGAVGTLGDWSLADPPTFRFAPVGDEYLFKSETNKENYCDVLVFLSCCLKGPQNIRGVFQWQIRVAQFPLLK